MRSTIWLTLATLALAAPTVAQDAPADAGTVEIHMPRIALDGVGFDAWLVPVGVPAGDSIDYRMALPGRPAAAAGTELSGRVAGGDSVLLEDLRIAGTGSMEVVATTSIGPAQGSVRVLPGWLALLPPLIAILLALIFREVVVSLLAGVWLGALFLYDWNPLTALWRTLDTYVVGAIVDPGHAMILVFSFLLGGMVGIISRNGGTYGVVEKITEHAVGPIRGQLAAYIMGLVIFFDDYSNTLIVGPTMRPLTDRLRISREKLAYIVDSTAAPVASIALISSWIGMEVGLIDDALDAMNLGYEPYVVFVQSILFRFYPLLALIFVLMVILTDRDYGPMLKAELRARREGKVIRDGARPASDLDNEALAPLAGKPRRWYNAIIPIAVMTIVTIAGMYVTGRNAILAAGETDFGLSNVFGNGDSYVSLIWASFSACAVAVILTLAQRILTLKEALEAWVTGLKAMLFAFVILVLAWALGQITLDVHTAEYLIHLLTGNIDPRLLPVIIFIVCALISFATGTSWGTMAIMMPVVVPLAVALSGEAGFGESDTYTILLGAVSSVLAGSVWGDHCSPISDTTILSSMATSCDHIDHVRTQMPYALLVGIVAMAVGDIPTAYGMSPWISLVLGSAILLGVLFIFGKREDSVP